MRGNSTFAVTIVSAILLMSMIPLPIAEGHGPVDQSFTGPFTTALRLDLVQPDTGQQFTPSEGVLAAVDLLFLDNGPDFVTITVKIRQGTINGPLIGEVTETVNVAGGSIGSPRAGHFDFSPLLVLTPNTIYVIEGITSNRVSWVGNNQADLYPGGKGIIKNFISTNVPFDFGFRTFFGELNPPTAAITSPSNNEILSTFPLIITGTASDDTNVAQVEVSIDGGPFQLATGTNSWTFDISNLFDGGHTVIARATDDFGNTSQSQLVNFTTVTIGLSIEGLINQLGNQLTGISNDINSVLTDTALILGILQDPNFGLEEIKQEIKDIEGNVTSQEFGLAEIKREVQTIETGVGAIQTETDKIQMLKDDVGMLKNQISSLEEKLDALLVPTVTCGAGTTLDTDTNQCVAVPVVTPSSIIDSLIAGVEDLVSGDMLDEKDAKKLLKELDDALEEVEEGNEEICKEVSKFVKNVNKLVDKGELDAAKAQPLLDEANSLLAECPTDNDE